MYDGPVCPSCGETEKFKEVGRTTVEFPLTMRRLDNGKFGADYEMCKPYEEGFVFEQMECGSCGEILDDDTTKQILDIVEGRSR